MRPVRPPSRLGLRSWFVSGFTGIVLIFPGAPSPGQTPAPAAAPPDKWVKVADLTNRYRFVEHYPREDGRELPGSLAPYRVGIIEVIREVIDQPKGAPRRSESTRQTVFVERATEQSGVGGVIGAVRSIERFDLQPADPGRSMGPNPLDGLAVGLRVRTGEWPLILPLGDRKPTDYEFEVITRQMVVPLIQQILPTQAIHVGDSWQVPRRGASALLGDPEVRGDTLTGRFTELRKEADGPKLAATIGVSGRTTTAIGETGVNAEITVTFLPEAPAKGPGGSAARPTEGIFDARGGITEVRLARTTAGDLPGAGRLRFQSSREITMERRFDIGDAGANLARLPKPPRADDTSIWLTWIDPGKRFRLDHPQALLPPERPALAPVESNTMALVRTSREGFDLLQVDFVGRALKPDDLKEKLTLKTKLTRNPVTMGEEGWLPEGEWANGKVYRIEAVVQTPAAGSTPGRGSRTHFDAYLIQPAQAAGILAIATTTREPITPFRREVEQILRSVQIDPTIPGEVKQ